MINPPRVFYVVTWLTLNTLANPTTAVPSITSLTTVTGSPITWEEVLDREDSDRGPSREFREKTDYVFVKHRPKTAKRRLDKVNLAYYCKRSIHTLTRANIHTDHTNVS